VTHTSMALTQAPFRRKSRPARQDSWWGLAGHAVPSAVPQPRRSLRSLRPCVRRLAVAVTVYSGICSPRSAIAPVPGPQDGTAT
jgi:hypothetical protein